MARFNETDRFHVNGPAEVDAHIRRILIPKIIRGYAFDCSRVDYPLNPVIYVIRLTPIEKSTYLPTDDYAPILETGVEHRREELSRV